VASTTTVCTITIGVAEGSTTTGAAGSVGTAAGALPHAVNTAASNSKMIFFMVHLLFEMMKNSITSSGFPPDKTA
jgi:hypothetical protein